MKKLLISLFCFLSFSAYSQNLSVSLKNDNINLQKNVDLTSMQEIFLWPQDMFEGKIDSIENVANNNFAISMQYLYNKDDIYYFKQNTYKISPASFSIAGKPSRKEIQKTTQEISFDKNSTKFFEFGINSGTQKFINYLELKIND